MIETLRCRSCGVTWERETFTGRKPHMCKPCKLARDLARVRQWRADNPERAEEAALRWRRENRERHTERVHRRRARLLGAEAVPVNPLEILARDNYTCHLCGMIVDTRYRARWTYNPMGWHMDHVIPLSKGGAHTPGNVATSHAWCNLTKGVNLTQPK